MIYTMKAHPTKYGATLFRSRLEARYAAYFDLCGFKWEYEPIDFEGWTPDFKIMVPCPYPHDPHGIFVEVKPYESAGQFDGHACQRFNKPPESPAIGLGLMPRIQTTTRFCSLTSVSHLTEWLSDNTVGFDNSWKYFDLEHDVRDGLWDEAGNRTRYKKEELCQN